MKLNELERESRLLQQDKQCILNCMEKIQCKINRISQMNESKCFLVSTIRKIKVWFWKQDYYSFKMDLFECEEEIQCIDEEISKIT